MAFEKCYSLPAKPAPVFDMLTSDRHLSTWFAEQVEIGTKAGEPFRFWGRHTLWTPEAADAKQTLTRFEFPSALGFSWMWRGAPTEVAIRIAADAEGTRVDLKHEFARPWPASDPDLGEARAARQDRIVAAFWDVAMANLAYYLFEGEALLLPDYSAAGQTPEHSLQIEAPAQEIFDALTLPANLDRWIAEKAEVELREGGTYRYGWTAPNGTPLGPTKLLAIRPAERLVHDWNWPGAPPSEVRWDLENLAERVGVRRSHTAMSPRDRIHELESCHALIALRAYQATGSTAAR